ncbi:MAG TPA: LysR family transcriptional regulator [Acidimicrobiales bacterium]|nr:LysR family transcriptional regulator [Acidimicrobiales bacterium]
MDIRQLAAVTAVADHGTFSAAADALGTVQSNVSAHVARLERELGAVLVDRSRGQLTEEGQVVVARARRVMAELEALVSDVAAVRNVVSGAVSLGMIGTTARWLAPVLLAESARRHPEVRITLAEAGSSVLEAELVDGRLDIAVTNLPVVDHDLAGERLFDEDLVLVLPPESPLASHGSIDLTELEGVPLLLPMRGTAFRDEIDDAVRPAGFSLTPRAELDGVRLIASLTFDGHGPAVLPATAVPGFLRSQWASVPVRGLPRRQVGLASRRRGLLPAPARALRAIVVEAVQAELAAGRRPGIHPPGETVPPADPPPARGR